MSNEKTFFLNKTHFNKFKKHCHKWINRLGLLDYKWWFEFQHMPEFEGYAGFNACWKGKTAVVTLNSEWRNQEPTDKALERAAFHECFEISMVRLHTMAEHGPQLGNDVESEIHSAVRRIENVLFGV